MNEMNIEITKDLARIDVARYILEVEFSTLEQAPYNPSDINDIEPLVEDIPIYHDGPRNSPKHLYAALRDPSLCWANAIIPLDQIVMGPTDSLLVYSFVQESDAFACGVAKLMLENDHFDELSEYFWDDEIIYPHVCAVLENYAEATPFLPNSKPLHDKVFKLKDGYHRTMQTIIRGHSHIPVLLGYKENFSAWNGYHEHLT